jgi:hypothetical protein
MRAHEMKPTVLHFLVLTVARWLQRRREVSIAYLLADNMVYKEYFAKTSRVEASRSRACSPAARCVAEANSAHLE